MTIFSFKDGTAAVVSPDELQQYEDWPSAFHDCCKDHRFYEIIEETLANDFEYQYLILRDLTGKMRGIQPFFFVQQNLIEGIPGGARRLVDSIRKKFPRFLTMRVLMVAAPLVKVISAPSAPLIQSGSPKRCMSVCLKSRARPKRHW